MYYWANFSIQYNLASQNQNFRPFNDPISLGFISDKKPSRWPKQTQKFKNQRRKLNKQREKNKRKIKNKNLSAGKIIEKQNSVYTQFWGVELTTELCLLEGDECGIGVPLGKKLKTRPSFRKRRFRQRNSDSWSELGEAFPLSFRVVLVLIAVQEPERRSRARRRTREKFFHLRRCGNLEE